MTTVVAYTLCLLILALCIRALVDCVRTPVSQIRGLPKAGVLLLPALPVLGTVLGIALWRSWGKRPVPVVPVTIVSEESSR